MKWSRFFVGCLWATLMVVAIIFKGSSFRVAYIVACLALVNAFSKD